MYSDEKNECPSPAAPSTEGQATMTSKKQAFLDHLAVCRQKFAQWPEWKQAFLKPPASTRLCDSEAKDRDNRNS
jgi:hypothetical protein